MGQWSWGSLGNRPIFFPVFFLLLGVAGGPGTDVPGPLWLVAALAFVIGAWWCGARAGAGLLVLAASACLGAGVSSLQATVEVPGWLSAGQRVTLEGEIEQVLQTEDGAQVGLAVARVGDEPARFRVSLACAEPLSLQPGQRVLVEAKLKPLTPAGNPGEWNRWRYHLRRAQAWTGRLEADRVVVLSAAPAWRLWLERSHEELAATVRRVAPDEASAALLLTLAAGLRAELDEAVEDDFARSGLAHVLSVSGLHVAVLAFALFRVLRELLVRLPGRFFRRVDPRAVAAPLAVPLVWSYVLFTGTQAPAVRSAVMCSLLLAGHALKRRSDPLNALGLAAGAMVLVEPASILDLSVQLSFVAVLALVLLAPSLRRAIPLEAPSPASDRGWRLRLGRWREAALTTFVASLAVTLATAPLVLSAFHRVGAAGLISNVVCLPLSAVLTLVASSGAALHLAWPTGALPLLWAGGWLSKVLVMAAHGFAGLPGASLALPAPPFFLWLLWWAGLGALVLLRGRWRGLALAAPLAAVLHLALLPRPVPGALDVTFLAVGHGDAIVLSSEGHHMLIDGGGVPEGLDTAKRFVLPFLQTRGIEALELAALTHPHPDHALGLTSALRSVAASRLWLPAGVGHGELVADLLDAAGAAAVEYVEAGHAAWPLGAAQVEVLGPPIDRVLLESENDRSLVLRVRHGLVTFLLPGDIESAGEEFLEPGPITVLKAPHHGSRSSSTEAFVGRARPQYVAFCVGRANRFGFPHDEVVDRYEAAGARCYRTDLDGAITFHSDGQHVTVETFSRREPGRARSADRPLRPPVAAPRLRPEP